MKNNISKRLIRNTCFTAILSGVVFIFPGEEASANGYIRFPASAWINPASMTLVKEFSATVGSTVVFYDTKTQATQFRVPPVSGVSRSTPTRYLPYGQIIQRINPKWTIGFDISSPLIAGTNYDKGFAQGIESYIDYQNYSFKTSYQVLDWLALGVGLDIGAGNRRAGTFVNNSLRTEDTWGTAVGWDAGFLVKIKPNMFLNFSYYSRNNWKPKGRSNFQNVQTQTKIGIPSPDAYTLGYDYIFSPKFRANLTGRFQKFDIFKNYTVSNPASSPGVPSVTPQNYKNTWVLSTGARYDFVPKWGLLLAGSFESDPTPRAFRFIGSPTGPVWTAVGGIVYMPTQNAEITVAFAQGFYNVRYNNAFNVGWTHARNRAVDFKLTYKY